MFRRSPGTNKKNNNAIHDKVREGQSARNKSFTNKVTFENDASFSNDTGKLICSMNRA